MSGSLGGVCIYPNIIGVLKRSLEFKYQRKVAKIATIFRENKHMLNLQRLMSNYYEDDPASQHLRVEFFFRETSTCSFKDIIAFCKNHADGIIHIFNVRYQFWPFCVQKYYNNVRRRVNTVNRFMTLRNRTGAPSYIDQLLHGLNLQVVGLNSDFTRKARTRIKGMWSRTISGLTQYNVRGHFLA